MPRIAHTVMGHQVDFERFEGVVVSSRESTFSTVNQRTQIIDGQVRPGLVGSQIHDLQEIWVRSDEGKEKNFDFSSLRIPLREGHRLAIVSGGSVEGDHEQVVSVNNLTTGELYSVPVGGVDSSYNDLARKIWKTGGFLREYLMVAAWVGGGLAMLVLMFSHNFFGAILTGVFFGFPLAVVVWLVGIVSKLSPRRRHELAYYKAVSALGATLAQ